MQFLTGLTAKSVGVSDREGLSATERASTHAACGQGGQGARPGAAVDQGHVPAEPAGRPHAPLPGTMPAHGDPAARTFASPGRVPTPFWWRSLARANYGAWNVSPDWSVYHILKVGPSTSARRDGSTKMSRCCRPRSWQCHSTGGGCGRRLCICLTHIHRCTGGIGHQTDQSEDAFEVPQCKHTKPIAGTYRY